MLILDLELNITYHRKSNFERLKKITLTESEGTSLLAVLQRITSMATLTRLVGSMIFVT